MLLSVHINRASFFTNKFSCASLDSSAPMSKPIKKIRKENRSVSQDVILNDTVIISNFGPEPQVVKCPFCGNFDTTRIKSKVSVKTHLCALVLCLTGFFICCGCPYCTNRRKNRHHYCSKCKAFLGSYRY